MSHELCWSVLSSRLLLNCGSVKQQTHSSLCVCVSLQRVVICVEEMMMLNLTNTRQMVQFPVGGCLSNSEVVRARQSEDTNINELFPWPLPS